MKVYVVEAGENLGPIQMVCGVFGSLAGAERFIEREAEKRKQGQFTFDRYEIGIYEIDQPDAPVERIC